VPQGRPISADYVTAPGSTRSTAISRTGWVNGAATGWRKLSAVRQRADATSDRERGRLDLWEVVLPEERGELHEATGPAVMCPPDATDRAGREHDQLLCAGPAPVRERGATVRPFPSSRRLVTAAVRAGRRIVPMHGLFDVDITTARRLLAEDDPPLSLTAFVIASLGRAAAAHPQVHAYRDWRGRLVEHRHVDVQTLIEVPTSQGPFGMVHVVRDADVRSVAEISVELRAVKTDHTTTPAGHLLDTVAPTVGRIPGLYRVMYAAMSRSRHVHLAAGTVQVTAVGMFADGGGFAIAPPTLASLVVVVGGVSKRPRAVGDRIAVRDVLDLTLTIDHNVVDGAPATRFAAELRLLMQTAAVLVPASTQDALGSRAGAESS
jgi:pyruvate/2-oxoglutarate dehydrogenase complex dihydrolipoamide acyltransferase (E2) component